MGSEAEHDSAPLARATGGVPARCSAFDTEPFDEIEFIGVKLADLSPEEVAQRIAARPSDAPFAYIVTPNAAHFNRLARIDDPRFRNAYDKAWMRLLDGQIPRKLAKLVFGLEIPLVTGSDLTLDLLNNHILPDDAVTIIGSTEPLQAALAERFGLRNIAFHVPPMGFVKNPAAFQECIDFVVAHPAKYVFLAVGAPRSEYLAEAISSTGKATGCGLCIGASLMFATGLTKRAPVIYRRFGMEWLHRLLSNPMVHARRIFVESLPIFAIVARYKIDERRAARAKPPS